MTERLLPDDFALRPYVDADRDQVAAAHAAHYREAEKFDENFDAAVIAALNDITSCLGRDRTFGLILQGADGARCGSIFACDTGAVARLRLFLIDRGLQGRGLGKALLTTALTKAHLAGFRCVEVSTFDAHSAACKIYARAGFVERTRTPCTAFGRRMVQVDFALDLRAA